MPSEYVSLINTLIIEKTTGTCMSQTGYITYSQIIRLPTARIHVLVPLVEAPIAGLEPEVAVKC